MQMRHLAQIEGQRDGVTVEKARKLTSREYRVGEVDGSTGFSLIRVLGAMWGRWAVEGKVVQRLGHRFTPAAEPANSRLQLPVDAAHKWRLLKSGRDLCVAEDAHYIHTTNFIIDFFFLFIYVGSGS